MEITNTKNLTAEQIVRALNSKGYLYYGESARVWNGNTQSRIYFGRDFVTILPDGTITNDKSGKRTLTIGDEAVEAIRDIVTPSASAEEPQEKPAGESATINTTTTRGTEVAITLTADTITAELTIPPFGKFTTEADIAPLKGQFALRGKVPTGENLFITVAEDVITDIIAKRQQLFQKQEERLFPGISELREITARWNKAWDKNRRAWDNIENNPAYSPINTAAIEAELNAARAKYPRAALALNATSYTLASHHSKIAAGKKALELLKNGGSLEEAQSILDNWLPQEAMWD
ncbi:hypothetical protein [Akkermansia sp.]|jgi:hypothetical protein|uniref:hypothetical protein n=1 Tax=Akkermansia sp. TaxID=1872421 RepID=UPI003AAC358C